jgi:Escherichia/Staphylococcus phage prohead protease
MNDNDNEREVARFIRAQTLKLRLAHLERLLADVGTDGAIETKAVDTLEWKQVDMASGRVTGYASAYAVDLGNDAIAPGAFQKTLSAARTFARAHKSPTLFPILWQHDKSEPIGYISEAREDSKGLRCVFHIDPSIERGRQALTGLKNGTLSFSIGYKPIAYSWQGGSPAVRLMKEIRLVEVSVVTFPMQVLARALPDAPDDRPDGPEEGAA